MKQKILLILLEGNDDKRFFEKIIVPLLEKKYDKIRIWKYAQQKHEKILNLIKTIRRQINSEIIYVSDINKAPCITAKKQEIINCFSNFLTNEDILVVVKEIESWYLSGLNDTALIALNIRQTFDNTDNITKKVFNSLIPKGRTRTELMIKMLKFFDIELGKKKNKSFRYFMEKWIE